MRGRNKDDISYFGIVCGFGVDEIYGMVRLRVLGFWIEVCLEG